MMMLNTGVRFKKVPPAQDLKHVVGWRRDVRIHFTLILAKNQNTSCKKLNINLWNVVITCNLCFYAKEL